MPQTRGQKTFFALLTVVITVHAYVFYSLYVINGNALTEYDGLFGGEPVSHVLKAIQILGGIEVFGTRVPIWAVVVIEFCLAFTLEMTVGSPLSFRLASRCFDPRKTHPVHFETAIICATVGIMCPAMSFLAAFLYYPYTAMDFNIFTLLANWLQLICLNLPFAFFSQLFFIQPFVRTVFKRVFRRSIGQQQKLAASEA